MYKRQHQASSQRCRTETWRRWRFPGVRRPPVTGVGLFQQLFLFLSGWLSVQQLLNKWDTTTDEVFFNLPLPALSHPQAHAAFTDSQMVAIPIFHGNKITVVISRFDHTRTTTRPTAFLPPSCKLLRHTSSAVAGLLTLTRTSQANMLRSNKIVPSCFQIVQQARTTMLLRYDH